MNPSLAGYLLSPSEDSFWTEKDGEEAWGVGMAIRSVWRGALVPTTACFKGENFFRFTQLSENVLSLCENFCFFPLLKTMQGRKRNCISHKIKEEEKNEAFVTNGL